MFQPRLGLVILDGWGYSAIENGNAIFQAKKPNYDYLWQNYPHTLIDASGSGAGLPWGNIGGSEVGHMCLGSGRVLYQELPRISRAITSGAFFKNPVFLEALSHTKKYNSNLHLIGLVSAAGVHSHINHLFALLDLLYRNKYRQPTFIQMITDGRDSPPKSATLFLNKIDEKVKQLHLNVRIASVIGRYFAMDRDSHWDRTRKAYDCLVLGKGLNAQNAYEALQNSYARKTTDEFIEPTVITGNAATNQNFLSKVINPKVQPTNNLPFGTIKDNDAIIFYNFRFERMTQLVETFLFPQSIFPDKKLLKNLFISTIVEYEKALPVKVALPSEKITMPLAKVISENHLTQIHMAETEKYNHVTYFFDGGNPVPFPGEEWIMVNSPKVATFDKKPEMSSAELIAKLFALLKSKNFDVAIINFANADMVGHTGDVGAAVKAVESIDAHLGELVKNLPNTTFVITADHGNVEEMLDPRTNRVNTEHSVNPVPLLLVGSDYKIDPQNQPPLNVMGLLADVAPTALEILKIKQPPEMTGLSLISSLKA